MKKTIFAGLTILDPGESLDTDNGAFTGRDREAIDRLLHVGAKTHRHNAAEGLTSPSVAPGAAITASAGTIGANLDISVGFTLEDSGGGETMLSPVATVSTGPAIGSPPAAPSAAADHTAGSLLINTYFYATTFTDGEGGETPLGPSVNAERAPGFASGRVVVSNLTFGMVAAGGKGWRLYRATGGGTFSLIATGSGEDTFIDDGTHSVECDVHPPAGEENTTRGVSTLLLTLPASGALIGATSFNVYASISGDFSGGAFLAQYPIASAGMMVSFPSLELGASAPPDVNLSIGGANKIDPDTELLDWHWKRPVETKAELPLTDEFGDVRVARDTDIPYIFTATGWRELQHHTLRRLLEAPGEYTLELGDDGNAIEIEAEEGSTILIPAGAVVPFPVGTVIELVRAGVGGLGVVASGGVTFNAAAGASAVSPQFGVAWLRKRAEDDWLLYGDLG